VNHAIRSDGKAAGCNALIAVTLAPFSVQAIRKVRDLRWNPIFFMNSISVSVPVTPSVVRAQHRGCLNAPSAERFASAANPAWSAVFCRAGQAQYVGVRDGELGLVDGSRRAQSSPADPATRARVDRPQVQGKVRHVSSVRRCSGAHRAIAEVKY
jgi:hypothetical protein